MDGTTPVGSPLSKAPQSVSKPAHSHTPQNLRASIMTDLERIMNTKRAASESVKHDFEATHTSNTHQHTSNTHQTHIKHTPTHIKHTSNTHQTHIKDTSNTHQTHIASSCFRESKPPLAFPTTTSVFLVDPVSTQAPGKQRLAEHKMADAAKSKNAPSSVARVQALNQRRFDRLHKNIRSAPSNTHAHAHPEQGT